MLFVFMLQRTHVEIAGVKALGLSFPLPQQTPSYGMSSFPSIPHLAPMSPRSTSPPRPPSSSRTDATW